VREWGIREFCKWRNGRSNWFVIDIRNLTFHRLNAFLMFIDQKEFVLWSTCWKLIWLDKMNGLLTDAVLKSIWFSVVIRNRSVICILHYPRNSVFSFFNSKVLVATFSRLAWHTLFRLWIWVVSVWDVCFTGQGMRSLLNEKNKVKFLEDLRPDWNILQN